MKNSISKHIGIEKKTINVIELPSMRGYFGKTVNYSKENIPRGGLVADLGFPREGGTNSPGGHQHMILPKFPKNCMKLKEFGRGGARPKFYYVDPPLHR